MDTSTKEIYSLLQSIFSLNSLLVVQTSQSITLGTKTITYVPHDENEYFYLGAFIEIDHKKDHDIYNEIIVRIWKDKTAEVYSLRQAHFGHYEETYTRKHGIEFANPKIRIESNVYFTDWLKSLQMGHGTLSLHENHD